MPIPSWDTTVNIIPQFVFTEEVEFKVLISSGDAGKERRRLKAGPFYTFKLVFDVLTATECDAIWNFYIARNGNYEAFTWTNPRDSVSHTVRFVEGKLSRQWFTANAHKLSLNLKKL